MTTITDDYSPPAFAERACALRASVREKKPLVQNITNFVSMDVVANVLLAIGASPAMVHAVEEVPEFIAFASALVINIGTLSQPWLDSMLVAAGAASARSLPWVLDPVGAGATSFRNAAVARLLALHPAIIRGNASEIMALAHIAGLSPSDIRPKGVDSLHATPAAEAAAIALARHQTCVVAATGAVDFITDGTRLVRLYNGHPLMTQVTALGCALSATVGAFAAVTPDMMEATVAAVAIYGVAGEMAGGALGPASFRSSFIDNLHRVTLSNMNQYMKISA